MRNHPLPQVAVLRDYLGTSLVHAYELRRLVVKKMILSSGSGALSA